MNPLKYIRIWKVELGLEYLEFEKIGKAIAIYW